MRRAIRLRATKSSHAQAEFSQGFIIGLTHTEIMLIFAVVILLLWMGRERELGEKIAALEKEKGKAEQQIADLVENQPGEKSVEETLEQMAQRQADEALREEVVDLLALEGQLSKEERPPTEEKDAVVASVKELLADKKRNDAFMEEFREAVGVENAAFSSASEDAKVAIALARMQQNADAVDRIKKAIFPEGQGKGVPAAGVAMRVESMVASLTVAQEEGVAVKSPASKNGDEVGFTPCWPGDASSGRTHYFAYTIHYTPAIGDTPEEFVIKPSKDWRNHARDGWKAPAMLCGMPSMAVCRH